jgi:hypothetical protein
LVPPIAGCSEAPVKRRNLHRFRSGAALVATPVAPWCVFFQSPAGSSRAPLNIRMTQYWSETHTPDFRLERDVNRLEELVRDLAGEPGTPNALMREHLEAARFYLLGSMPHEYRLSLKLAKDLLPDIEDKGLQNRIADFLQSQESTSA